MILRIVVLSLIALAIAMAIYKPVHAEPMAAAEAGGVRLVIHTEDCKLKEITNLAKRATWTQDGKTQEGCAGLFQEVGMVIFYFTDKTAFPVPVQMFTRVTNS
jgi:hypothetical protein